MQPSFAITVDPLKMAPTIVWTVQVVKSCAIPAWCWFIRVIHCMELRCIIFYMACIFLFNIYSQHWMDDCYFEKTNLKKLGLWIQLGHRAWEKCHNIAQAAGDDFVVLDVNGIHEVRLNFCDCEMSKLEFIQLLWYGWFPASVNHPKTAATLSVLKNFQILTFESKASPFEFYNTLAHLTNNTGLSTPKVCGMWLLPDMMNNYC